jgi:2-C-methyl-D-erythritol 4-phosphate cytidylyltransferase/2-C-methyl-D-erythritol 2,4-cyclodiphosphate synthase
VVAAGSSTRFGRDKLEARIGGRTVLEHAVGAVRAALPGVPTCLVVRPDAVAGARARWTGDGLLVVAGGPRRQDSVRLGVEALALDEAAVVVIHDAARPFVPAADVQSVAAAAAAAGAALLVAPVVDTIKEVSAEGRVARTVPRTALARALTPQAFAVSVLRAAWAGGGQAEEWTDEAALVEASGQPVRAVTGDPRNVKVTTEGDLPMLGAVLGGGVKVGFGVDVHPFAAGRRLWLGGIEIPSEVGLAGHSDADAVLHAVTDAILGGCAAGDIGEHFPPSDERWRDAPSALFVRRALELAAERGLKVTHCDVTVLAERPRIGPHREAIAASLASLLSLERGDIGVKATTCEGLGFVGRAEGLMATAVVTLDWR